MILNRCPATTKLTRLQSERSEDYGSSRSLLRVDVDENRESAVVERVWEESCEPRTFTHRVRDTNARRTQRTGLVRRQSRTVRDAAGVHLGFIVEVARGQSFIGERRGREEDGIAAEGLH